MTKTEEKQQGTQTSSGMTVGDLIRTLQDFPGDTPVNLAVAESPGRFVIAKIDSIYTWGGEGVFIRQGDIQR